MPTAAPRTTLGLGIRDGGPLGLRPAAAGLAFTPTYQGEVQAMDASGYGYELAAYDDASTDGTLARLRRPRRGSRRLTVVAFRRNGGSGTVRRIGTQDARGQIVVWTDADMTYPNEQIPALVAMLAEDPGTDQVVGARTSEEGSHKLLRVPAKWFIRKLAERLTGTPDPGPELRAAGFPPPGRRCLTCGCCRRGFPASPRSRSRSWPASTTCATSRSATPGGPGTSKFHFVKDAYRYILQVLRMVMYFNPLKVLMPIALALLGLGAAKGVYDLIAHPVHIAGDTVLIFVSGLIIATLALLADLIVRSRSTCEAADGATLGLPAGGYPVPAGRVSAGVGPAGPSPGLRRSYDLNDEESAAPAPPEGGWQPHCSERQRCWPGGGWLAPLPAAAAASAAR